jgi:hypothetical protein
MEPGTEGAEAPVNARQLDTPAATALADLASIFEELSMVLGCCEQLMMEINKGEEASSQVIEGLWTTTLLCYGRCFAPNDRGMGLTEADLSETGIEGEVVEWHKMLTKMRKHFASPKENPRERFTVGITQNTDGTPSGVAVMSTTTPTLDEVTVRQTGSIAYALSQLVNQRIKDQQEAVLNSAQKMRVEDLNALQAVELTTSDG